MTSVKRSKRKQKNCQGCWDLFFTYKNFDYCPDCAVNGNRYLVRSDCSECDCSGVIKFWSQKPRPCKLCYLSKKTMSKFNKKLTPEQENEKYWDEVDLLAQEKIYQLLTRNVPLPNLKLITEPYRYEDKQEKLTGLFLHKDVDFRTLLGDVEMQYEEEDLPDKEVMAEEVAIWYLRLVMKALISDLSEFTPFEKNYFEGLTEPEN